MLQGREEPGREKRAERRNVGEKLTIERIDQFSQASRVTPIEVECDSWQIASRYVFHFKGVCFLPNNGPTGQNIREFGIELGKQIVVDRIMQPQDEQIADVPHAVILCQGYCHLCNAGRKYCNAFMLWIKQ